MLIWNTESKSALILTANLIFLNVDGERNWIFILSLDVS